METEVLEVGYTYNPDFYRRDIKEQIFSLAEKFGLDPDKALDYLYFKDNSTQLLEQDGYHSQDGLFAVISPFGFKHLLGYKREDVFNPNFYCESLNFLLEKISKNFTFINYRKDLINPLNFFQTENSLEGYGKLSFFQGESHIWIINAQLGFFLQNQPASINLGVSEYGLTSSFMGSILLTHPKFVGDNFSPMLSGICVGDRFSDNTAPQFFSNGAALMYNSVSVKNSYPKAGPMTFFQ
jgi:hypothetical protein